MARQSETRAGLVPSKGIKGHIGDTYCSILGVFLLSTLKVHPKCGLKVKEPCYSPLKKRTLLLEEVIFSQWP